jgi:hypothetical protein
MSYQVCPGCKRSILPLERLERDKKKHITWRIFYCPFERCNYNIDLEETEIKVWNNEKGFFEDYLP